ncbi:MAG: PHP-associated domain-containing protein, partial [Elusimicrobiota bacterium]
LYIILNMSTLIDLHIHTSRHSPCSILRPETAVRKAITAGLDGIVITEHDFIWPEEEIELLKTKNNSDLKIFRGVEFDSPAGHLLIYGFYDCRKLKDLNLDEIIKTVNSNGGIVINAHPFRYAYPPKTDFTFINEKLKIFEGIEVYNGNQDEATNKFASRTGNNINTALTGGSDAHNKNMVGKFCTEFSCPINTERDIVRAIRQNKCSPVKL